MRWEPSNHCTDRYGMQNGLGQLSLNRKSLPEAYRFVPGEAGAQGGKVERLALEHALRDGKARWVFGMVSSGFKQFELGDKVGGYAVHSCTLFLRDGAKRSEWVESFGGVDNGGAVSPSRQVAQDQAETVYKRAPTWYGGQKLVASRASS